jgi:hypothetical protein
MYASNIKPLHAPKSFSTCPSNQTRMLVIGELTPPILQCSAFAEPPSHPFYSSSPLHSLPIFPIQRHRRSHSLPPQIQRWPWLSWYHKPPCPPLDCSAVTRPTGVLVLRKSLITHSRPPTQPGGGTVYFVSSQHVRYMPVAEEREEAGTPNTLGCVRAGLAFALKAALFPFLQQRRYSFLVTLSNNCGRSAWVCSAYPPVKQWHAPLLARCSSTLTFN